MASVMAIGSTNSDATSYNFLGNNVLKPVIGTIQIQDNLDGTATTSFTLRSLSGVTDAQIRAQIDALSDIAETIDLYWSDPLVVDDIWLKMYADGETACWSLIHKMVIQPAPMSLYTPLMGYNYAQYTVAITHDNWREKTTSKILERTKLQCFSSADNQWIKRIIPIANITSTLGGSLPGRMNIELYSSYYSREINRVWVGLKPKYNGTTNVTNSYTDFQPFWQLKNGTLGTDAATRQATSCWPGSKTNCVRVSFATTGVMTQRVAITPTQSTGASPIQHNQFVGKYLVLLRCSLDAAGEVGLKLKVGFQGGENYVEKETKYFDNTAWRYLELGEVYIPPYGRSGSYEYTFNDIALTELQIDAERTTGNCNLDMNGLMLIPSQHMAYIDDINLDYTSETSNYGRVYVIDKPDGTKDVKSINSTGYRREVPLAYFRQWETPQDGALLIIAAEQTDLANTGLATSFVLTNYWRSRIHSV